ncbi:zinc finger protein 184 isoform X2 [Syngnathus scovelli]|uniref:zinc finger protein 184 isoform X2 n=1 Tax=Syngnathus scovelli TaxID=161590 RepID=UPI00210FD85D|nr:zinc finger protein 616 isoform X2 [Syngnathus scovelli]XP_049587133.1 zinc finger protein 616 isoform X2 [Syngnathus scovelli]
MGSKISFSRRRSDQYTVSELTAVTSHPRRSFPPPTDCKEVAGNTECIEESHNFEWGENMTNPCRPLSASPSSETLKFQETLKSEGPVESNSQPIGASQLGIDAKAEMAPANVCHLKTGDHGLQVVRQSKRGRPRKIKHSKDKMFPTTAELVADQHEEIGAATQVPTFSESSNAEIVTKRVKGLLNVLPHNETSATCAVPDHKPEDGVPLVPKKRGRPKKQKMAENLVDDLASRTQKLRSHKGRISASVVPKEMEVSPTLKSSTKRQAIENLQTDHQTPAKVFKTDVSASMVSGDTDSWDIAEMDNMLGSGEEDLQSLPEKNSGQLLLRPAECLAVESDGQYLEMNLCRNKDDISPGSVVREALEQRDSDHQQSVELQQPKAAEGVTPQIKQEAEETFCTPQIQLVDVKSLKESQSDCDDSSQTTKPIDNNIATSSEDPPKVLEIPSTIKVENIEASLDHIDPLSQSNNCAKLPISSEGQYLRHTTLRRRKGRKRRTRVTVLLRHEGKSETQHQTEEEYKNTDAEVDQNIIYTQKGSKTMLTCAICNRTYKFMSQYIIHQRVHTGERPFECPECKKGFSKKSNLNLHLKTHIKNTLTKETPHGKNFSGDQYFSHTTTHTTGAEQDISKFTGDKETVGNALASEKNESKLCQYCGKSFKFQSALVRHERVHTREKPYKCDICGKAFGQSYFLRVHELTHWPVKRYNCTACKKSFSHYSNAKNHTCRPPGGQPSNLLAKPSLTYTCHICKNILDSLQKFNKHMRGHIGTKLYRCLYCDKLFALRSEFNAHCGVCLREKNGSCVTVKEEERMSVVEYTVSAHRISSEQKFSCLPAEGQFENHKRSLRLNGNTGKATRPLSYFVSKLNQLDNRSDPRNYLCPNCGRLFRHIGRLRAHMLTHAPHQSYTCSFCGKTLQNWTKLWRHQRIHRQRRGRFRCVLCGKGFRFVHSYKEHMSEHPSFRWIQSKPRTVSLPYNCDQCTSRFKTLDLLFSHQRCHFSTQVTRLGPALDQSSNDQSTSTLNPTTFCFESENNTLMSSVPNAQNPKDSPNSSKQKQTKTSSPRNTGMREKPRKSPRKDENVLKKQKPTGRTSSPKKEFLQDFICAVCGDEYKSLSDLHSHYMQHARGEV